MAEGGVVEQIDAAIAAFFATGNSWTLFLAGLLFLLLIWPILTGKDPDIHPFLLARQAQASPVRMRGESAVFRANEIPYGFPLRKGLGVKDPGAPAWSAGRDGDLRDVWRKAVQGATDDKGNPLGKKGKFLTILGREKVIEHKFEDVTKTINAVGGIIQEKGGKTVAVSLSNSVELLAIIFASAFYGFKPVLIPYGLDQIKLQSLISQAKPDILIAEAATVMLESTLSATPSLKHVVWVVRGESCDIDWTDRPAGVGKVTITTWQDHVEKRQASSEVLTSEKDSKTGPIAAFWKGKGGRHELIEYSPQSIVAGTGGLLGTLVREHKITHKDILLPSASLTETYTLCWTLAALFSGASIALNSVAGDSVDLTLAAAGVSPTIIVSSSGTISKHQEKIAAYAPGLPQKLTNYLQRRDMQSGIMSSKKPKTISPNFSALRVLLVSQRDTEDTKISSSILSGLRIALGTRVAYALTSESVAGAVTQTNILDYRDKGKAVNVGAPLTNSELYLVGDDALLDTPTPEGTLVVRGPAVVGEQDELDVAVRIEVDRTITLL